MPEICALQPDDDIACTAQPCTVEAHEHTLIHDPGCPHPVVGAVLHGINTYKACPECGGTNFEVRNYNETWRDGDVHCVDCGAYVRTYDAG